MCDQQVVSIRRESSDRPAFLPHFPDKPSSALSDLGRRKQLVFATFGHVRCIVDHPQFAGPGNNGTDAAFIVPLLVVGTVLAVDTVRCQMRVDSADEQVGREASGWSSKDTADRPPASFFAEQPDDGMLERTLRWRRVADQGRDASASRFASMSRIIHDVLQFGQNQIQGHIVLRT